MVCLVVTLYNISNIKIMKKILHINCHPDFGNREHTTNYLSGYGLELLKKRTELDIEELNLYDNQINIPQISPLMYSVWSKQEQNMSEEERNIWIIQNQLTNQWIEADYIFIYSPLHNFNITSRFKDYIDNILIAGKTFKYTKSGSVGLLDKNKKIVYIQSSGASYNTDLRYINSDIAPHYIRTILSFMGIEQMDLIRVQGLNMSIYNRNNIIQNAKMELENYICSNIITKAI